MECEQLSAEWNRVSISLGLTPGQIASIRHDHSNDCFSCWSEALNQWLKQKHSTDLYGKPSWRTLLRAVANVDKALFKRLAEEHTGMTNNSYPHCLCLGGGGDGVHKVPWPEQNICMYKPLWIDS